MLFDIVMRKGFPLDDVGFEKISGLYDMGDSQMGVYREGNLLFIEWNGQIIEGMYYKGNNFFEAGGGMYKIQFELLPGGGAKAKLSILDDAAGEGKKILKYRVPR